MVPSSRFHVLGLPARSSGFHTCFTVTTGFGSFSCRSSLTMTCGEAAGQGSEVEASEWVAPGGGKGGGDGGGGDGGSDGGSGEGDGGEGGGDAGVGRRGRRRRWRWRQWPWRRRRRRRARAGMARARAVKGRHHTHLREQAAELRDRPVDGLKHSSRARAGRRRRDDAFNVDADVTKARQGPRGVNGTRVSPFSFLSPCLPYPRGGIWRYCSTTPVLCGSAVAR